MWAGRIEAAVLVHNVRSERVDQLARTQHRLAGARIRLLGVAENFAPAGAYRRAA